MYAELYLKLMDKINEKRLNEKESNFSAVLLFPLFINEFRVSKLIQKYFVSVEYTIYILSRHNFLGLYFIFILVFAIILYFAISLHQIKQHCSDCSQFHNYWFLEP